MNNYALVIILNVTIIKHMQIEMAVYEKQENVLYKGKKISRNFVSWFSSFKIKNFVNERINKFSLIFFSRIKITNFKNRI